MKSTASAEWIRELKKMGKILMSLFLFILNGRKSEDDWVSACRNVVVALVRCASRGRKTWYECVKDDMKVLGLHPEWAVFRDMWRGFISGGTSNPS